MSLVGGWYKRIAYVLPFAYAGDAGKAALRGNYSEMLPYLYWIIGYAIDIMMIAVIVFKKKKNSDEI